MPLTAVVLPFVPVRRASKFCQRIFGILALPDDWEKKAN